MEILTDMDDFLQHQLQEALLARNTVMVCGVVMKLLEIEGFEVPFNEKLLSAIEDVVDFVDDDIFHGYSEMMADFAEIMRDARNGEFKTSLGELIEDSLDDRKILEAFEALLQDSDAGPLNAVLAERKALGSVQFIKAAESSTG